MSSSEFGSPAAAAFAATPWSVVLEARRDSAGRREALERLCTLYWLPVYSYLRRRGHAPADAEDLTQSFFVYMLESDFLDRPDPMKGRFRGYLVGALRHFLGTHFERERAEKRGGGATWIEWTLVDAESEYSAVNQPQLDPADAYEATWALTLLGRALQRLEAEQSTGDRMKAFTVLKPFLSSSASRGDYDQAAQRLGTRRTTVAVWVHRLNERYAELVKLEVAQTVQDPAAVEEELQHLRRALLR